MTETNVQQAETLSIEELSKKVQEATQELNQLKNGLNGLSLQEKSDRLAELESSILDCSESLTELEADSEISIDKNELESLRSKINTLESDKELLKQQIEAQTKAEIQVLNQSVAQQETQPEGGEQQSEGGDQQNKTEKGWFGRQREGLTTREGWKEHPGRNILWTLGGVGIVAGVCSLFKRHDYESEIPGYSEMSRKEKRLARRKLRKEKRAERRENRPWRQKFLIGAGIATGTVVGGVEVYKHWNQIKSRVKEKLGLALSFDEAMYTVEAEVRNGINKDMNFGNMCAHFEGMSYDENTEEICSFGERVKINKKNKTIVGKGIEEVHFASWEELFHAVNIINFAKSNLRGLGSNPTPFSVNNITGDIDFSLSEEGKTQFISANGSNFWTWVLGGGGAGAGGLLGGYYLGLKGGLTGAVTGGLIGYTIGSVIDNTSTMGHACETIAKGANLQRFVNYLNEQNIWEGKDQEKEDDNTSPVHPYLNRIIDEIESSHGIGSGENRNLKIEYDETNPSEIKLTSYKQTVTLKLEGNTAKKGEDLDFSKITKITLGKYNDGGEDLNIDFNTNDEKGLVEAIRVGNLTNKLRDRYKYGATNDCPFSFGYYAALDGYYCFGVDTGSWVFGGENHQGGTNILTYSTLEKDYPILLNDLKKYNDIISDWYRTTPSQADLRAQAYGDKQNKGSQYIKYLHQMGPLRGKYWKNPN